MLDTKLFQDLDIRVFPLGVDIDIFKPKLKINSNSNNKIKLLYVGMIVERKRIHLGIDVVKGLLSNGFNKSPQCLLLLAIFSLVFLLEYLPKTENPEEDFGIFGRNTPGAEALLA